VSERLEVHGDHYARGARYDFAVNVLTDPHPPWLAAAIAVGVRAIGEYPDEEPAQVAVAERHARAPEEVVLVNGAAQAFTLLAQALRPDRPVVVHPAFTEPERVLRAAPAVLPEPWCLHPRAVPGAADLVVVGNPTNPTGVLHRRAAIRELCRAGRVTVVDEAFMDFVPGEPESLAAERGLPGLVVVRSITKVLGVPGARAGYVLADAPLAARLRHARPAWSLNSVALAILEAAARRPEHAAAVAAETARRRSALSAALRPLAGVVVHPGAANFLLLETPAAGLADELRSRHGIAVRPAAGFPGLRPGHVRVAVRGEPLDALLVDALGETLQLSRV
jgi:histidinol-phosphate aminotransferase